MLSVRYGVVHVFYSKGRDANDVVFVRVSGAFLCCFVISASEMKACGGDGVR